VKRRAAVYRPHRIAISTLRFDQSFSNLRASLLTTEDDLPKMVESMKPMFDPEMLLKKGTKNASYRSSEKEMSLLKMTIIIPFTLLQI
jgi:hypothetical protein